MVDLGTMKIDFDALVIFLFPVNGLVALFEKNERYL
jgi:hypothetical protein